jgi:hypothetical protein
MFSGVRGPHEVFLARAVQGTLRHHQGRCLPGCPLVLLECPLPEQSLLFTLAALLLLRSAILVTFRSSACTQATPCLRRSTDVQVISQSCDDCIRSVIKFTHSPVCLPKVRLPLAFPRWCCHASCLPSCCSALPPAFLPDFLLLATASHLSCVAAQRPLTSPPCPGAEFECDWPVIWFAACGGLRGLARDRAAALRRVHCPVRGPVHPGQWCVSGLLVWRCCDVCGRGVWTCVSLRVLWRGEAVMLLRCVALLQRAPRCPS